MGGLFGGAASGGAASGSAGSAATGAAASGATSALAADTLASSAASTAPATVATSPAVSSLSSDAVKMSQNAPEFSELNSQGPLQATSTKSTDPTRQASFTDNYKKYKGLAPSGGGGSYQSPSYNFSGAPQSNVEVAQSQQFNALMEYLTKQGRG